MRARRAVLRLADRRSAKRTTAWARKSGSPSSTTQNIRAPLIERMARTACVLATATSVAALSFVLSAEALARWRTSSLDMWTSRASERPPLCGSRKSCTGKAAVASSPSGARCSRRKTNLAKLSSSRTVPASRRFVPDAPRCTLHVHPCASVPNRLGSRGIAFTMSGGNDRPLNGIEASTSTPPASSHT